MAKRVEALSDSLRIFQRVCEAVAFAHARGILHRDLKPENIMVGPFGEVLVMDWGVAKILHDVPNGSERQAPDDSELREKSRAAPIHRRPLTERFSARRATWPPSRRAAKWIGSTRARIFIRWARFSSSSSPSRVRRRRRDRFGSGRRAHSARKAANPRRTQWQPSREKPWLTNLTGAMHR